MTLLRFESSRERDYFRRWYDAVGPSPDDTIRLHPGKESPVTDPIHDMLAVHQRVYERISRHTPDDALVYDLSAAMDALEEEHLRLVLAGALPGPAPAPATAGG